MRTLAQKLRDGGQSRGYREPSGLPAAWPASADSIGIFFLKDASACCRRNLNNAWLVALPETDSHGGEAAHLSARTSVQLAVEFGASCAHPSLPAVRHSVKVSVASRPHDHPWSRKGTED